MLLLLLDFESLEEDLPMLKSSNVIFFSCSFYIYLGIDFCDF